MRVFSFLMIIMIVVVGLSFAMLNAEPVVFNYYFGENSLPLSLLMVYTLGVGSLMGMLASLGLFIKVKRENRKLKKKAKLAEKEVANLRALPLQDEH